MYDSGEQQSKTVTSESTTSQEKIEEVKTEGIPSLDSRDGLKHLCFEFIALEACLEAACSSLDNEVSPFYRC